MACAITLYCKDDADQFDIADIHIYTHIIYKTEDRVTPNLWLLTNYHDFPSVLCCCTTHTLRPVNFIGTNNRDKFKWLEIKCAQAGSQRSSFYMCFVVFIC